MPVVDGKLVGEIFGPIVQVLLPRPLRLLREATVAEMTDEVAHLTRAYAVSKNSG